MLELKNWIPYVCCHGNHFCQILVAMAMISRHFTSFRDENIKFISKPHFTILKVSELLGWFTLVDNSLVSHQLLVTQVK